MSSGSYSDAQIFNRSDLREKTKDSSLEFQAPEPLGEGGPDLHYLLGDDAFALMPWIEKTLQQKTTHKGRKNSKLQDIQRQAGG